MGNIINPIGGRLGFMTFWKMTWPVFFNQNFQDRFFQLSVHLRILFHSFFQKVFSFNPRHSSPSVLHGMLIKLVTNLNGFQNQNLSVFLKFFDYKVSVNSLAFYKRRSFVKMVIYRVRKLFLIKSWLKGNPLVKVGRSGSARFLKLKYFINRSLFYRRRKSKMRRYIKFYIRRGSKLLLNLLRKRIVRWHFNLILFTKPYLLFVCKLFNLRSCFIYTRLSKSSISAAMIVNYMILKLKQGFNLNFVLKSVRRSLKSFLRNASGYKLCLAGRFTRKQIATYRWVKFGDLSLNQQTSGIDYAQSSGISKFGLFGIKFWVFKHPILNKRV